MRKGVYTSYAIRRATVALFVGTLLVVLGTIALFPAYGAIRSEIAFQMAVSQSAVVSSGQDPMKMAEEAGRQLGVLANREIPAKLSAHEAVDLVLLHKGNIIIEGINYKRSVGIGVRGKAPDRTSLLAFTRSLQSDSKVSGLDLPISALLSEKDISFNFIIELK
ncbi:MAG: hypothetical protein COV07_01615 [Candidatus Vogelbacteria bacterium CG10_big_fil_rev_8_21_14_0_10_45_14]|uniref:Uncharacterized protein n=1 Tax=Candidatus Vogelbacteria bacterium CG10_big_fil_rev_8_21_14_0_10_45_14 TaxID=1975042 RepID=A0A2H0RK53_9BACT|nr:MAG: hypothetical protein COV07_01615 [Candidatus Vogelbacteria bacterium CG10_big_fil_rev_8_21_14_0_10_45_14]